MTQEEMLQSYHAMTERRRTAWRAAVKDYSATPHAKRLEAERKRRVRAGRPPKRRAPSHGGWMDPFTP